MQADTSTPRTFDVAADGRFLMIEERNNATPAMLMLVTGWGEIVKAKVR
ncbi:MAG TPA: hypothetical protein VEL51_05430 [Vicinamibacterales bacterium]|nr:hypothetical protein [Vicinamibacterales bacterium]